MPDKSLPGALPLFDTHAHLDFDRFEEDFDEVLVRAQAAGLQHIVTIGAGAGATSVDRAIRIADKHDWIYATVGVHPHDASVVTDEVVQAVRDASDHPKVVAIGETGLDYHYNRSPRDKQREAFSQFVAMAVEVDKPVMVHTRDADEDTIRILREGGAEQCGGIIHCFSSSTWLADCALEMGFYLSFSGIVTFKGAQNVHEVACSAPLDRILVETDAPYLAPIPRRGERNEPAFVNYTLRRIATLRGMEPEELARVTTENAKRVFGID